MHVGILAPQPPVAHDDRIDCPHAARQIGDLINHRKEHLLMRHRHVCPQRTTAAQPGQPHRDVSRWRRPQLVAHCQPKRVKRRLLKRRRQRMLDRVPNQPNPPPQLVSYLHTMPAVVAFSASRITVTLSLSKGRIPLYAPSLLSLHVLLDILLMLLGCPREGV